MTRYITVRRTTDGAIATMPLCPGKFYELTGAQWALMHDTLIPHSDGMGKDLRVPANVSSTQFELCRQIANGV